MRGLDDHITGHGGEDFLREGSSVIPEERYRGVRAQVAEGGFLAGWNAAQWLLDGNSSEEQARYLLDGLDNGDPMVIDALPSFTFGEWAGESMTEVLDSVLPWDIDAADLLDAELDDFADTYLDAYHVGAQRGAENVARAFLGLSHKDQWGAVFASTYANEEV